MKFNKNPIYLEDLDKAIAVMDLSPLANRSVLITGATGLIGSAITDLLLRWNALSSSGMTVYAAGRNPEKTAGRFDHDPALVPVQYDALSALSFDFAADYIIHTAGIASPDVYIRDPVGTMLGNINGIRDLLDYGLQCHAAKTVYLSSSEVYGVGVSAEPLTEGQYGYVDILNPRSSYPMGKRAAETMCVSHSLQFGSQVSIARPGHVYGPTASTRDKRVSSAFAWQAARGEALELKSAGTQIRSYCYCLDCASAVLQILLRGGNGEAYNISNPDSVITIRRMAEILAAAGGVPLTGHVPTEAEKAAFNPMENASLDSRKLEALGWKGVFPAEIGLNHTVALLRDSL